MMRGRLTTLTTFETDEGAMSRRTWVMGRGGRRTGLDQRGGKDDGVGAIGGNGGNNFMSLGLFGGCLVSS